MRVATWWPWGGPRQLRLPSLHFIILPSSFASRGLPLALPSIDSGFCILHSSFYLLFCRSFLFADETVSNTIPCEVHMVRGIAMTTDTCRQSGDGDGFRARAVTRAKLTGNT